MWGLVNVIDFLRCRNEEGAVSFSTAWVYCRADFLFGSSLSTNLDVLHVMASTRICVWCLDSLGRLQDEIGRCDANVLGLVHS